MLHRDQRLGPYQIIAPLGAGGMGEVYRARDTRLHRDVAIKVVAPDLAADPSAIARFEREARAVAALSHPNILAIHDVGREGGIAFAVTELLEGQSLAEVLAAGALSVRRTIEYATAIASGLAAAHDRGIVHRDIKPANLFVRTDGRLTILDFGLACQDAREKSDRSATATSDTARGAILGTVGYMAPEQVRGQPVDHRTDIFAFGAVLYEMLSGRRAFSAATAADTISAILNADPPELVPDESGLSSPLEAIIRRCLAKEPSNRFQSTRDLAFALEATGQRTSGSAARSAPVTSEPRRHLPVAASGAVIAAAAAAWLAWPARAAPITAAVVRFEINATLSNPPSVAVSPGGRSLSWTTTTQRSHRTSTFVRRLDEPEPFEVTQAEGAGNSSWRDEERLVTVRGASMYTSDLTSGNATPAAELERGTGDARHRGTAFNADDVLVGAGDAIVRFASGLSSARTVVASPDATYQWLGFPQWLPDRRILYMGSRANGGTLEALVQPLAGGKAVPVSLPAGISRVLVDPDGALLYGLNGSLVAQRYDLASLEPLTEPVTIASGVAMDRRSGTLAADIGAHVLAYRPGGTVVTQFEWRTRTGATVGTLGAPGPYFNFDLSPDATRVAVIHRTDQSGNALWLIDNRRNMAAPIRNAQEGAISDPTWSPDGRRLVYRRGSTVVVRDVLGGDERVISSRLGYPDSWSPDGRFIAVGRPNGTSYELWAISLDSPTDERPIVTGLPLADEPRFSPDGRWVAYHARTDAIAQVFVVPFPPSGEVIQVSAHGGVQPRWRGDGHELFFLDPTGRIMTVDMRNGEPRLAAEPRVLFDAGVTPSEITDQFTATHDGRRFLVRRDVNAATPSPVKVILNWRQLLGDARR